MYVNLLRGSSSSGLPRGAPSTGKDVWGADRLHRTALWGGYGSGAAWPSSASGTPSVAACNLGRTRPSVRA